MWKSSGFLVEMVLGLVGEVEIQTITNCFRE